jgi:hypothetical protein
MFRRGLVQFQWGYGEDFCHCSPNISGEVLWDAKSELTLTTLTNCQGGSGSFCRVMMLATTMAAPPLHVLMNVCDTTNLTIRSLLSLRSVSE